MLALVGGTIYVNPADAPIPNGIILIEADKIIAVGTQTLVHVPQSVETVDCSNLTITAGFWNSHVHFFERKWADAANIPTPELNRQLEDFTRYGFTSVFDLSSKWENTRRLRDRVESGGVLGPSIRSTGEGMVPPGILPSDAVLGALGSMKTPLLEITGAAEATAAAKKLLEAGVDGLKLFASGSAPSMPALSESTMHAAIKEGRRSKKPSFVHPNTSDDVLTALRAGVDVIAHTTPRSDSWDEAILTLMKERQAALTPTLRAWKYLMRHDRQSIQEQYVAHSIGQLRAWHTAGGSVLFGTDVGAVDTDSSEEYALMTEAGMSFRQILTSLTTAPAERFGQAKRLGQIAKGFQADLVVFNRDPEKDIGALAAVQYTLRLGRVTYSAP